MLDMLDIIYDELNYDEIIQEQVKGRIRYIRTTRMMKWSHLLSLSHHFQHQYQLSMDLIKNWQLR